MLIELFGSLCLLNLFVLILSEKKFVEKATLTLLMKQIVKISKSVAPDLFLSSFYIQQTNYVPRALLYLIVCWHNLFFLVFQCVMGNGHRHFYMEIKKVSSTEFSALPFCSPLIQLLLLSFFALPAPGLS